MKVSDVIAKLQANYAPDADIMCVWWGNEYREVEHGVWQRAVKVFHDYEYPTKWDEYVTDIITSVEDAMQDEAREDAFWSGVGNAGI